jgi:hypothetical protein
VFSFAAVSYLPLFEARRRRGRNLLEREEERKERRKEKREKRQEEKEKKKEGMMSLAAATRAGRCAEEMMRRADKERAKRGE